ncbi:MAG: triose-phosphate isomerase [Bdellovibrionales bacterium]|nr:triose-phosphate isomerase [Bdellovibrionales bacterium]
MESNNKGTSSLPFLLCANWKMHKNPDSVRDYIRAINKLPALKYPKRFIFFAPALTLFVLAEELVNSSYGWGAQNCHFEDQGAFTGENSPLVLKQMGATYCLVGHSERRQLFFESEEMVQKKVKSLLNHSIQPIVCVGENIKERKNKQSFQVVENQLSGILKNIDSLDRICVAYEPVWAIGTGKVAGVEQITEMQEHIRHLCATEGKTLHFLYGGSVNEKNIKELSQIPGVNGFLIGSASLDPLSFFNLAQNLVPAKAGI